MPRRVWVMNLKDDRGNKNNDISLKFRLCRERNILAIGWDVMTVVNSWQEYKQEADKIWNAHRNYVTGRNAIERMRNGDLVWVKDPEGGKYYLAEITDLSAEPSIYNSLREFDVCVYRKCTYYAVENTALVGAIAPRKIVARHALEEKHQLSFIDATNQLFNRL